MAGLESAGIPGHHRFSGGHAAVMIWAEKNSLAYKNIRVILPAEDFQRWHSQFAG